MSEFEEITREGLIDMLQESQELIAALQEKIEELQFINARIITAAAGRGMVSEMADMREVVVLVCGLHDKIAEIETEHKYMSEQIDKLNTPMPCGHLARYVVNGDEGTQYCLVCEANAANLRSEQTYADLREAHRCLTQAVKFVYHYYGDDKEALAHMETSTWRTFLEDMQRNGHV